SIVPVIDLLRNAEGTMLFALDQAVFGIHAVDRAVDQPAALVVDRYPGAVLLLDRIEIEVRDGDQLFAARALRRRQDLVKRLGRILQHHLRIEERPFAGHDHFGFGEALRFDHFGFGEALRFDLEADGQDRRLSHFLHHTPEFDLAALHVGEVVAAVPDPAHRAPDPAADDDRLRVFGRAEPR